MNASQPQAVTSTSGNMPDVSGSEKPEVTKRKKRRPRRYRGKKNKENTNTPAADTCENQQVKNQSVPNRIVQSNATISQTAKPNQTGTVPANVDTCLGKLIASIKSIQKPITSAAAIGTTGEGNVGSTNAVKEELKSKNGQNEKKTKKGRVFRRTNISNGGGGGGGQTARNQGPQIKDYGKVRAEFQCENEDCRKKWSSAHGWTSRPDELCYDCNNKAKIVNIECGTMWVETFRCNGYHGPEGGANTWSSLTEYSEENPCPLMVMDCDICGMDTQSGGAQYRFGRHFWFKCRNPDCGLEWEDFNSESDYTQHCSKCNRPGNQLGFRRETDKEQSQRAGRGGYGGAAHNVNGCDMCQRLQKDGIARNCIMKKRVVISSTFENGVASDRVISTQDSNNY